MQAACRPVQLPWRRLKRSVRGSFATSARRRVIAFAGARKRQRIRAREHFGGIGSPLSASARARFKILASRMAMLGKKRSVRHLAIGDREGGVAAAAYVDQVLRAANPASLPVEQATRFELVINNLKTAKTLGLTIPPSLLLRADHVIQ
jgi:hypothetical protein